MSHFQPGDGLYIPFTAGHYIKNGPEDVSISMSIIFRAQQSNTWLKAMCLNNRLRKRLEVQTTSVGQSSSRDKIKSTIFPVVDFPARISHRLLRG